MRQAAGGRRHGGAGGWRQAQAGAAGGPSPRRRLPGVAPRRRGGKEALHRLAGASHAPLHRPRGRPPLLHGLALAVRLTPSHLGRARLASPSPSPSPRIAVASHRRRSRLASPRPRPRLASPRPRLASPRPRPRLALARVRVRPGGSVASHMALVAAPPCMACHAAHRLQPWPDGCPASRARCRSPPVPPSPPRPRVLPPASCCARARRHRGQARPAAARDACLARDARTTHPRLVVRLGRF